MPTTWPAPDTNDEADIFVYDRQTASLEIVSIGLDGKPAGCNGSRPSISADGNCIVFVSSAANLAAGDTNGKDHIFVWERSSKTIARLEHPSGMNSIGGINNAVISADGNYIACEIFDEQYRNYIYVYNRHGGTAELVSRKHANPAAPGYGYDPAISADGRKIVFYSADSTLVASDTNGKEDVFVYDRLEKDIQLVSVSTEGVQGNNLSTSPAISANGRFVAFKSCATNLAVGAAGGYYNQVFVRDLAEGRTEIVSLAADGTPANGDSSYGSSPPALSANGRYVVFDSDADNLVSADQNNSCDIFSCDRELTMTDAERVAADKEALLWDCIGGNNTAGDNVMTGLILPGSGANGTIITWHADPAGWIDIPAGTVTRPAAAEGDQAVALTAAISKGTASDTVTFDLTIKAREAPPVLSETGASALASTTATLHFTADKAGTYYCLVYEAAQTHPDAAALKAQGEAAAKGSGPAEAAANRVRLAGLTAATGYTAYLIVETDDGCSSAVAEISFETAEPDEPLDECFIATAAFGSKLEPSVVLLRRCRDEWLLSNAPGRAFVNFYYAHSPALAAKVAAHAGIKYIVRLMLLPVIALAWAMLNLGAALPVLLAAAVCLIMIRRKNRKMV